MKCPVCGFDKAKVKVFPLYCICGTKVYEDGSFLSPKKDNCVRIYDYDNDNILGILKICIECEYFRQHDKAGGRCSHKNCRCGGGIDPVIVDNIKINSGLLNMIKLGKCPIGKW